MLAILFIAALLGLAGSTLALKYTIESFFSIRPQNRVDAEAISHFIVGLIASIAFVLLTIVVIAS